MVAARDVVDQVTPERDAQFAAGFFQTGEGVAALAAGVAAGAAADFFLSDMIADIAFAAVGVKRDIRSLQDKQQFGLILVPPRQEPVQ